MSAARGFTRLLAATITLTTLTFAACAGQESSSRDNATAADAGHRVTASNDATASFEDASGDCEADVAACLDTCGSREDCVETCHRTMARCFGQPAAIDPALSTAMKQQMACDEAFSQCISAEGCVPAEPASTDASTTSDGSSIEACQTVCQTKLDTCLQKLD